MENKIEQFWQQFRQRCIAPEATPLQLDHMEIAFYGGALALLADLVSLETEEDVLVRIAIFRVELGYFTARMKARAALRASRASVN